MADGADFLDVGGVKAGPGPEVDRGRGARPGRPGDRGAARPLRPAALGRHLAGVGRRGAASRPAPSSATTSAASPTPTTSRRAPTPARRWWPPTSGSRPRVPDPEPLYDDVVADGARRSSPTGPPRPRPPASRASGSWSTPASTSARPSRSRSSCCAPPTDLAALGYPVFLSASNKRFLGLLAHRTSTIAPRPPGARHALGIALGCRVLRAHDVRGGGASPT